MKNICQPLRVAAGFAALAIRPTILGRAKHARTSSCIWRVIYLESLVSKKILYPTPKRLKKLLLGIDLLSGYRGHAGLPFLTYSNSKCNLCEIMKNYGSTKIALYSNEFCQYLFICYRCYMYIHTRSPSIEYWVLSYFKKG